MRKVKFEILAAAIAAVPCTVFAGEDAGKTRPAVLDRPAYQSGQLQAGGSFGRFTLSPVPQQQLNGGPDDNGNFTWVGPNEGTWQVGTNWTPNGVPDGNAANAFITELNGGGVVVLNGNVTLNSLNFSDPLIAAVAGPTSGASQTITMAGAAQVNHQFFPSEDFPNTGKFFGTPIGLPALAPDPARPVLLGGTSGVNYSGGATAIRFDNTYTGNTTVNANTRVTVLAGATLDGAFGTAGNVVLNGGEVWVEIDNGTLNKNVVVNPAGGILSLGTDPNNAATSNQTINGVISGSGPLRIDNTFGGNGIFTAANTITGSVRFEGLGTNTLQGGGGFASASSIRSGGTIVLAGAGANRLPDASQIQMNGGAIRIDNLGGAYTETVGSTNLLTATPAIIVRPGGGTVFNGGNLTRGAGTGIEVRGQGLGGTPGSGVTNVNFTNANTFVTNGIIPWAYGSSADVFFNGVESTTTELLGVGPNGLAPFSALGSYLENTFTGAGATTNVRLNAGFDGTQNVSPNHTAAGNITVNSLTFTPGFDDQGNGVGGIFLGGNATINVTSGAVLSASSGFSGGAINSGIGNTILSGITLNFGSVEAVLNSPGAMTSFATITGTGGLTKTGVRTLFMNGTTSTYTGTTTLTGFNRHMGNLIAGQPSAYGASTTPIVLVPFDRQQDDPGLGVTGIPFVSFGPDAGAGETTMTRALQIKAGGNGELVSTLFRNFAGATFNMDGQIQIDADANAIFQALSGGNDIYDVGGTITGPGHAGTTVSAGQLTLFLRGNNTFSGGFDLAGGDVHVENNAAFGTGLVTVTGDTTVQSAGGPRTIANPMLLSAGALRVRGTNPFTFTGNVALGGTLLDVNANNTATFSGVLSEGQLFKEGAGTAVLSGNNTFHGTLSAGNLTAQLAPIDGGWIVLASNGAAGAATGQAQIIGASAIGLTGGITTADKPVLITSNTNGPDGQGNLRSLSGNNTWSGGILLADINAAPGGPTSGSVGANAGASLNVGRSVFVTGDTASTFTFTKFGAGQVNVGHDQFTSGTSTFQGSIVGVNNLVVNQGRLAMTPHGAEGPHVSDVGSIALNGAAQFDLTDNALVVDYASGGPSPLADIRSKIVSGFAGGAWTGPGIMSSAANANQFGVGYVENNGSASGTSYTTFLGDPVDNSAILVRHTRYGDADVNGLVNLGDFNRLAANFGLAAGAVWGQGDFDYNGIVNLADFNRLAANFGLSAGPDGPTPDDWANLAAAIPEPSALGLAAVGAVALMRRRRRA